MCPATLMAVPRPIVSLILALRLGAERIRRRAAGWSVLFDFVMSEPSCRGYRVADPTSASRAVDATADRPAPAGRHA
jgi:hypothetical protein